MSRTFIEQTVGFYFAINDIKVADIDTLPEESYQQASDLSSDAYSALLKSLPNLPEWQVADESDPEITYSPYQVCEEDIDVSESGEFAGFGFWIFSEQRLTEKTIHAFKVEVVRQYENAAKAKGMSCVYLRAEKSTTEKVSTTDILDI